MSAYWMSSTMKDQTAATDALCLSFWDQALIVLSEVPCLFHLAKLHPDKTA